MASDTAKRWAAMHPYIIRRLRDVYARGYVDADTDRESSARAQILVRRGLAVRTGVRWTPRSGARLAEYQLTPLGTAVLQEADRG